MKSTLLLTIYILAIVSLANSQTPLLDLKLTVSDDTGGRQELYFGLDAAATSGLDAALGENELPPFPPTGVFEARFVGDDISVSELGQGTYQDYRTGDAGFEGMVEHEIRYQPDAASSQIEIAWNFPEGVTATLEDFFAGSVVNQAMSDSGSYVLTNLGVNRLKMTVTYNGFVTSVGRTGGATPVQFQLHQNYPNPFNPSTNISYALANETQVILAVYNLLGQEIVRLVDGMQKAGEYKILFNARGIPSGVYLYKIQTDGFSASRKLMLIK